MPQRIRQNRLCLVIAIAAFSAALADAQQFGEVTGTVTDSSGAVVAGASLTVTNTATQQVRTVPTNDTGNYSVPYLVPGSYQVKAEKQGFKVSARNAVDVQVGGVARIDFRMELGQLSQQVEVTGGAPLLTTESVALGSVIETKQIVDLPLNGRDYLSLVALSPNVVGEAPSTGGSGLQGGVRSQTALSIAGQRLEFNHYTLDGVENTDPNFNSYIIHPSVDALQEFKVQTGVYSAEFGRGASQINVTTISGTNQYHLSAFEFLRNSYFDAKEWEQVGAKNPFRRNDYGFTLGGPISIPKLFSGKDRLFFMSNFEELRDRLTTQQTASVPTAAMRNGDFSLLGKTIYDPSTRIFTGSASGSATAFPNNQIPASRFNPGALALLAYYPLPTVPGNSMVRNYIRQAVSPTDSDQFNQRVDFIQNSKSTWFGRYSWGNDSQTPPTVFLTDSSHAATTVRQAVIANTYIFSPSIVNEARFAWDQFNNDLDGYFANTTNVQATLGISGLFAPSPLAYGLPSVAFGGGISSFGGVTPWITRNDTFQWTDGVSITKGTHSIKVGGEIRRDRYNQYGNQKATGEFDFDGQSTSNPANPNATGYTFADLLVGLPSQAYRVVAMADGLLRRTSYAAYIQDDWKITKKLTFNLGLRYENGRPWHDKYRGLINAQVFSLGTGPNGAYLLPNAPSPILTRPGAGDFYDGLNFRYAQGQPVQSGDQYMGRSLVNPNNLNFGPRIGMAYSPNDKWSMRAGFGIFYVQDIGNAVFDMSRNLAGRDGNVIPANARTQTLSAPWAQEAANAKCPGWTGTCLVAPQILANAQNNRTPYVEQYLANIQRQLTQNLILEVGYLGNQGHRLDRFVIYNQAIPKTGPSDSSSITQRRPFPSFGPLQEVDGVVNSNYNALDFKLTQRFTKGLTYTAGYTWSKAIDDGSAIRNNSGDTLWPTNSYNLHAERGLSQFDLPRRFVGSVLYELPFGEGKPLVNSGILSRVIGGWQVGAIVTLADGTAMNVAQLGDTASLGTLGNQPDATGISPIPTNRSAGQFWNIAAINVTNPALSSRPGNMGRNTLFTPGTEDLDASLMKNFRIWEQHTLNFRFENFNALNHPNWNPPSADARTASTFGVITSAKSMRQMQFALKYTF